MVAVLAIIIPTASYVSFAATAPSWEVSESGERLYNGETVYFSHDVPELYCLTYWQTHVIQQGSMLQTGVVSFADNDDILFVDNDLTTYYADEQAQTALEKYFNGEEGLFYATERNEYYIAEVDGLKDVFETLANASAKNISVTKLENRLKARALFVDKSHTFKKTLGDFYLLDDGTYFVYYEGLPNNAFDAQGNLSYRSGEVTIFKLTDEHAQLVDEISFDYYKYVFGENKPNDPDDYPTVRGTTITEISVCVFSIGLPLAIIITAAIIMIKNRKKGAKRLLFIVIPAALWLIAGVVMVILL